MGFRVGMDTHETKAFIFTWVGIKILGLCGLAREIGWVREGFKTQLDMGFRVGMDVRVFWGI